MCIQCSFRALNEIKTGGGGGGGGGDELNALSSYIDMFMHVYNNLRGMKIDLACFFD